MHGGHEDYCSKLKVRFSVAVLWVQEEAFFFFPFLLPSIYLSMGKNRIGEKNLREL